MRKKSAEDTPLTFKRLKRRAISKASVIVFAVISILLSVVYLALAWARYQDIYNSEAIKLGESIETMLPAQRILDLKAKEGDKQSEEYALIKERMVRLVEKIDLIYYAYLMVEQDGNILVLVDSNADDTSSYSPLGNLREELIDSNWKPFETETSVLTKPVHNEWGDWIRALVPVKNYKTGEIIAILGLSYSASKWDESVRTRMVPDILISLSLLTLLMFLFWMLFKNAKLKEKSERLAFDEALYRSVFEQAPIGITVSAYNDGNVGSEFISANPMAERIMGRDVQKLRKTNWVDITDKESMAEELPLFAQFTKGEIDGYMMEKCLRKPNGEYVWVNIHTSALKRSEDTRFVYLCLTEDISARKALEKTLKESERSKSVLLFHLPGMAYRCRYDREWTMEFVSEGCRALTGYAPESLLYNREISFNDVISPEYRQLLWDKWISVLEQRKSFRYEYEIVTKTGERKWVLELGQGVFDENGTVEALEGIILDISEQKKRDMQIAYLNERDFLTGLYNRNYMERKKARLSEEAHLPLSIAVLDIDGLRMINDAYGQTQGDLLIMEAAKLLQNFIRPTDVLGRISGGEFMLLMPNTPGEDAYEITKGIQATIESYNRLKQQALYEISLTVGYSTIETTDQDVDDEIKKARSYLKHRKLLKQKSLHHSILSTIMATLYAKSQETEEHGQRLGEYAGMIGERFDLEQKAFDDLRLLAMLHDIGKIGIDDSILNKPDKLTAQEWEQMKKHPEIGYRIAMSTPELSHIASYILHHHERYDGKGYPKGLSGEEIPLLSRILAVADAYDAMTEDRVYRSALSPKAALEEIRRGAGTQFDPHIASIFIDMITSKTGEAR